MTNPRLLFIVKQKQGESLWGTPGNKKPGLSNSIESLVRALVQQGINAEIQDVPDRNSIHGVVSRIKPDVVIIEAYWVTPAKLQFLKVLHPNVHWIVRNHSEVPFLAQEGNAGTWNCEYLKMGIEVGSVSTRTVEDLTPLVNNLGVHPNLLSFLPNVYLDDLVERVPPSPLPRKAIHIGCFGAVRTLKNHFEQAMAAIGYAQEIECDLFFHINATRVEGSGSQPLKNLQGTFRRLHNCELVEHPWMNKEEFYHLLRTEIDVLLQCSLTESFNIVAADAVLCSVPVVASPEIRWLGHASHCNPTSVVDIIKALHRVFSRGYVEVRNYCDDQLADLQTYNKRSLAVWCDRFK